MSPRRVRLDLTETGALHGADSKQLMQHLSDWHDPARFYAENNSTPLGVAWKIGPKCDLPFERVTTQKGTLGKIANIRAGSAMFHSTVSLPQ
jgi:hypothetical protein